MYILQYENVWTWREGREEKTEREGKREEGSQTDWTDVNVRAQSPGAIIQAVGICLLFG